MKPSLNKISYKKQLSILQETKEWLDNLKIESENTRFSKVLEIITKLSNSYKDSDKINFLIDEYGNLVLWQAVIDANSFIEIYQTFQSEKNHLIPRSSLKKILNGPLLPWDEDTNTRNIESRNELFELETAALFKKAGAKIIGFDDVTIEYQRTQFNIQCKRIHSFKKVSDNVNEAISQVTERMKSKSKTKGILSICIDKITDKERKILHVNDAKDIRPEMEKFLVDFMNKYHRLWMNLLNINILGILIVGHAVSWIKEEQGTLLTTCRQTVVDVLPRNDFWQGNDYRLMLGLAIKMQAAEHTLLNNTPL